MGILMAFLERIVSLDWGSYEIGANAITQERGFRCSKDQGSVSRSECPLYVFSNAAACMKRCIFELAAEIYSAT